MDDRYFHYLGRGLAERGMRLMFGSLTVTEVPAWCLEVPDLKYFSFGTTKRSQYPAAAVSLARLLRRWRVDILQTHLFDAGAVGLAAARLAGTPAVVHMRHHLDEHALIGTRLHVQADRCMILAADRAVVPSRAAREYLIRYEAINPDKIDTIPLGWDFHEVRASPEDGKRIRAELGLDSAFVLGTVARFIPFKGHEVLLAAAARLRSAIPDLRLLFVGDGPRDYLYRRMEELRLPREVVIFAGYRRDVMACMRAMDILVHPSLSESLPQVLVEALAAETAVIATDVGGSAEIVDDDETGLLVPSGDPAALVGAVLTLHADDAMRRQFGRTGRQRVMRRFPVQRMLDRQVQCYERCLAPSRSLWTT